MDSKIIGAYPNFGSFVSKQINDSMLFCWRLVNTSNDTQASYTITVEDASSVEIFTLDGGSESIAIIPEEYRERLQEGHTYTWSVRTEDISGIGTQSDKFRFRVQHISYLDGLNWPTGPESYENIHTRQYFNEIKSNAITIVGDYIIDSAEEMDMITSLQTLFTGEVVPTRDDFLKLERCLDMIARKEATYSGDIDELIEDGLGAEDIHKIYNLFRRMLQHPPSPPTNIDLRVSNFEGVKIASGTSTNGGERDTKISVRWTTTELQKPNASLSLGAALNEDVLYYKVALNVGYTDFVVPQMYYFTPSDFYSLGGNILIDMDFVFFENYSKTKETYFGLVANAYDRRGNESPSHYSTHAPGKLPLGPESYKLRCMLGTVTSSISSHPTGSDIIKEWGQTWSGTDAFLEYEVGRTAVYYYSVCVVDKNGTESAYYDILPGVKVKPLQIPEPPTPFVRTVGQISIRIGWNNVEDADKYQVRLMTTGTPTSPNESSQSHLFTGLQQSVTYFMYVRAGNEKGWSDWNHVKETTADAPEPPTPPKPNVLQQTSGFDWLCWRTPFVIYHQNGKVERSNGGWRTKQNAEDILQGEWIQLRDKVEDGQAVKKGTRYGNHKSYILLDSAKWQKDLKGRKVLKVELYLQRNSSHHGFPSQGNDLYVGYHDYKNLNVSSLPSSPAGYNVQRINENFATGQGQWVELPAHWGTRIGAGEARGFLLYNANAANDPQSNYSYMRFLPGQVKLRITVE